MVMIIKRILFSTTLLLFVGIIFSSCNKDNNMGNGNGVNGSGSGKGGSLARFTISGNYMYAVDESKLFAYDITNQANPQLVKTSDIGFNIETIFPYEDKLFIGSQDAMYVYSIANPSNPVQIGRASHLRACDPVVASDEVAYVTVRSGSFCGGNMNALFVYDISDPQLPIERNTLQLLNPYGLGVEGNAVYVCDSNDGLKVYERGTGNKKYDLTYTTSKGGYTFYDCIPYNDILICMVEGGMVLYNIENRLQPTEVAKIMN